MEVSHVYVLGLKGKPVYVGQSRNVHKRVAEHRSSRKDFDSFWFEDCAVEQRRDRERQIISATKPQGNIVGNPDCLAPPTTVYPLRLPAATLDLLYEMGAEQDRTPAYFIRVALREWIERRRK